MKFLVTGGAGFIGSHIVERLLKEGHFVRVIDDLSSGNLENLSFIHSIPNTHDSRPNYEFIKGDIRDKGLIKKAMKGIDYVLHQAALRSVPKSLTDPKLYNDVNINGTLNILEEAKKANIKRVVIASSSSIYGETDKLPEKEEFLPRLISPYALTKLAGEYYSRIFSSIYGLETVNLRYFNVFGPRQSLENKYAVVIPKFITCMLRDEAPPIHGDGTQTRDFTYVDNVVQANIKAATASNIKCEVLNIACGSSYSVLDIVKYVNKILAKDIKPQFMPIRLGDVKDTLADIKKARELIGFEPKVDFEEGLKRTVEYLKKEIR